MLMSPSDWVRSRIDDGYYTPDNAKLFRKPWHPLFVYGTLRDGFFRHKALSDCPKVGTGFTRGRVWKLYRTPPSKTLGSYPIALPTVTTEDQGALYGEIYLVPPKLMRELDFIESNGIQYSRIHRAVDVLGVKPIVLTCWMYVGRAVAWQDAVNKKGILPLPKFTWKREPGFHYYVFRKSDAT